jgi:hypothetical protein
MDYESSVGTDSFEPEFAEVGFEFERFYRQGLEREK